MRAETLQSDTSLSHPDGVATKHTSVNPTTRAISDLLQFPLKDMRVEPLNGHSFVSIHHVVWEDTHRVVKHTSNPEKTWRITNEMQGYQLMHNQPIQQRMPRIHQTIAAHEVLGPTIVMEYLPGSNLRKIIHEKLLVPTQILDILNEVLDMQKASWQFQAYVPHPTEWFSLQKAEWKETVRLLARVMRVWSLETHIPEELLFNKKINLSDGITTRNLPSINELLARLSSFLQREPPVALELAYNDLSLANVVATTTEKTPAVRVVDAEWVHTMSDPAPDLSRPLKITLASMSAVSNMVTTNHANEIRVTYDTCTPSLLLHMEHEAYKQVGSFANIIGDSTLAHRVHMSLAASYIRDIALGAKGKGSTQEIGFNLMQAARFLGLAEF